MSKARVFQTLSTFALFALLIQPAFPQFLGSITDSHKIDSVDLSTLDVSISIPLKQTQVGLPMGISLAQRNGHYTVPTVSGRYWVANIDDQLWPQMTTLRPPRVRALFGPCPACYKEWAIVGSDGIQHFLADISDQLPNTFPLATTDGSGYTVTSDSVVHDDQGFSYSGGGVFDCPPQSPPCGPGNITITDPNGRSVSEVFSYVNPGTGGSPTSMTAAWKDSTGATILSAPAFSDGNTPHQFTFTSYSYTDGYGSTQTYTPSNFLTLYSGVTPNFVQDLTTLPQSIALPDTSSYSLSYEPGSNLGYIEGSRILSIVSPSGETIQYSYSGGDTGYNYGVWLVDGSEAIVTRSSSQTGTVTYSHTPDPNSCGYTTEPLSVSPNKICGGTTTVTNSANTEKTVYTFAIISYTNTLSNGSISNSSARIPIQVDYYQSGTLILTKKMCFQGVGMTSPACGVQPRGLSGPITEEDVYSYYTGVAQPALTKIFYNSNQYVAEQQDFDFGGTTPLVDTVYAYGSFSGGSCVAIGNYITKRLCTVTVYDGAKSPQSVIRYTYDAHGNKTAESHSASASSFLTTHFSYDANGALHTITDPNGTITTYANTQCGNFLPGSASVSGLTASYTWDCTTGQLLTVTDSNQQVKSSAYGDPLGRITSTTDQLGNVTGYSYGVGGVRTTTSLSINGGASAQQSVALLDSALRPSSVQAREGPQSTKYDTVSQAYDVNGRQSFVSMPCVANLGAGCTTTNGTSITYDVLGRVTNVANSMSPVGTVTMQYVGRDMRQTLSPAPTGESNKAKQFELDGLGRLISVCEITGGGASCGQASAATGYLTQYQYNVFGRIIQVNQSGQLRMIVYDQMGRVTSETTPESGAIKYFYDTAPATPGSACSVTASAGNLVKRFDANGNTTCYTYDGLHRLTSAIYSGPNSNTENKYFVWDAATVNGVILPFAKGRLAEAYTATCATCTKVTDTGFGYSARGEIAQVLEKTPHSGGFYNTSSTQWENGALQGLSGVPGLGPVAWGLDPKGRLKSTLRGTTSLVSSVSYNSADQATVVTYGSGDHDNYGYAAQTGRMSSFGFSIGSTPTTVSGTLTWNPNGTLKKMALIDPLNTSSTQTCTYAYDDLTRLGGAACGSVWSQSFSYDAFGNITKSGSLTFNPGYDITKNRYTSLPGLSYDSSGHLLNDSFHSYTWSAENRPLTVDSTNLKYDAFDRLVEITKSSGSTELLYSPLGKTALMNGQSTVRAFIPLAGGEQSEYLATGALDLIHHKDYLGSARLVTQLANRSLYSDESYAPFGEQYGASGTAATDFTGQESDIVAGIYDFPMREYSASQGRWISPDSFGSTVANATDPQSWNRYTYGSNDPLVNVDPSGLLDCSGVFACIDLIFNGFDPNTINSDWFIWGGGFGSGSETFDPWYGNTMAQQVFTDPVFIAANDFVTDFTLFEVGAVTAAIGGPAIASTAVTASRAAVTGWYVYGAPLTTLLACDSFCNGINPWPKVSAASVESIEATPQVLQIWKQWPDNQGFVGGYVKDEVVQIGGVFSRIGSTAGHYVAPVGTTLSESGLPSDYPNQIVSLWEVTEKFPLKAGISAPWKGALGGGVQYLLPMSVEELAARGYIKPYVPGH